MSASAADAPFRSFVAVAQGLRSEVVELLGGNASRDDWLLSLESRACRDIEGELDAAGRRLLEQAKPLKNTAAVRRAIAQTLDSIGHLQLFIPGHGPPLDVVIAICRGRLRRLGGLVGSKLDAGEPRESAADLVTQRSVKEIGGVLASAGAPLGWRSPR